MEHRYPNHITELRARTEAGDKNAAGRLGELLAKSGDREGALRVWAEAYGDSRPTTRRLAELKVEDGDLDDAVSTWKFSDIVWQNPEGLHQEYLNTLDHEDRMEAEYCDPEDWGFMEAEKLTWMLANRGMRRRSRTCGPGSLPVSSPRSCWLTVKNAIAAERKRRGNPKALLRSDLRPM